jgi:erythronate-4-phosphate dehydrogenase
MIIVADANMRAVEETFGRHGEVRLHRGRSLTRSHLRGAQALLVRSVTRVDGDLLQGTPVEFVGTATIGTDHLDVPWLEKQRIAWASAPGCNAAAAAQYTLAMMLLAWRRLRRDPARESVGIIGRGNVGGRLQSLLQALHIPTLACDPPLAERGITGLVDRHRVLAQSTVTLHVPLTHHGPHATRGFFGRAELDALPRDALLVNAARGAVLRAEPLGAWLRADRGQVALDTWPDEPSIDPALLAASVVGTPHVAGYSEDGKRRGTAMIYQAFCKHFGLSHQSLPELPSEPLAWEAGGAGAADGVTRAVLAATGAARDDAAMRTLAELTPKARGLAFDALRRDYPPRREFRFLRLTNAPEAARPKLAALGFGFTDRRE